eukprot:1190475-Prorocentrum_minimum.AAC.2
MGANRRREVSIYPEQGPIAGGKREVSIYPERGPIAGGKRAEHAETRASSIGASTPPPLDAASASTARSTKRRLMERHLSAR